MEMLVELIEHNTEKLPHGASNPTETKNQYEKLEVAISKSEDRISEIRRILGRDVDGSIKIRHEIAGAEERLEEIDLPSVDVKFGIVADGFAGYGDAMRISIPDTNFAALHKSSTNVCL